MKNFQSEDIDRYLTGKLTGEVKVRFEEKLKNDPVFAETFEQHKEAFSAARIYRDRNELREKLLHRGKTKLKNRKVMRQYLPAAAAVLLLLLAIPFLYEMIIPTAPSNNFPVAVNEFVAQMEPLSFSVLGETEHDWTTAVNLYKNEKYSEAAKDFEMLLSNENFDKKNLNKAMIYLSFCQIKTGAPGKALVELEKIPKEAIRYYNKAKWLKAVARSQINEKDPEAIRLLREIISDERFSEANREEATILLKIMEKK